MDNPEDNIHIEINNFRTIDKLEIFLSNQTILIGKNNSGKSNIMTALNKAFNKGIFEITDICNKRLEDDYKAKLLELESFSNLGESEKLTLKNDVSKYIGNNSKRSTVNIWVDSGGEKEIYQSTAEVNGKFDWVDKKPPFDILYLSAIPILKEATNTANTTILGKLLNDKFSKTYTEKINVIICEALKKIREIPETDALEIINSLKSEMKKIIPDINNIEYLPTDFDAKKLVTDRQLLISDKWIESVEWTNLGHGLQRLLIMLLFTQLASKKIQDNKSNLILLIEEPEIFMHPHQQKAVSDKLFEIVGNKNFKIVLSTHSSYFIDPMNIHSLRIISKINGLTKVSNNGSGLYDFSINYLKSKGIDVLGSDKYFFEFFTSLRLEPELREFFFADKVLLVEGYNERIAIPWLLMKQGHNLNSNDISIYNSRGNSKLLNHAKILDKFGIPYIIALDDDKGDTDTLREIKSLKDYLENRFEETVSILYGDFCSIFGLVKKDEFNVYNRIDEIETESWHFSDDDKIHLEKYLKDIVCKLGIDNSLASKL